MNYPLGLDRENIVSTCERCGFAKSIDICKFQAGKERKSIDRVEGMIAEMEKGIVFSFSFPASARLDDIATCLSEWTGTCRNDSGASGVG